MCMLLYVPFQRVEDNALATAALLLLLLIYLSGAIVKIFHDISDYADVIHVSNFTSRILGFQSSEGIITIMLIVAFALLIMIGFSVYVALQRDKHLQKLRLRSNGRPPSLDLEKGHRWMLFLSHVSE